MRFKSSATLAGAFTLLFFFISGTAYAETRAITFPLSGTYSFRDDFSEPRDGGARTHLGVDIIAAKMTPIVAVVDGTITFIAIPQASWGYSITLTGSDGYSYRYLHMNNDTPGTDDGAGGEANAYASGLHRGSHVTAGQLIGWVGDSGNAEETVSHLHFELHTPDRTAIDPYDTLLAAAGNKSSGQSTVVVQHGNDSGIAEEEKFVITRPLQEGMTDPDIATLNTDLKALGYYSGTISQKYTSVTREAVRSFQNANKITATGIADAGTRKAIAAAALLVPKTVTPTPVTQVSGLSQGASGKAVTDLQTTLQALGYFSADITGYFGSVTKAAVIAFQKAKGIDPIGSVGPLTASALKNAQGETASLGTLTSLLKKGSTGDEMKTLQTILMREGYFSGEATGYFGAVTEEALKAFQKAHGLEAVGFVGPKTRSALNAIK